MQTIILIGIFIASSLATGFVRYYVRKKNILDVPNVRSSHQVPTPRGGGIAFVSLFSLTIFALFFEDQISSSLFYALFAGLLIAGIGILDDIRSVPALYRACLHLVVACWAIFCLGNFGDSILGAAISIFVIVWCINLYNFMDGVDGLAGSEGLFVSLASAIALLMLGSTDSSFIFLLLAACIGGFLIWNWPPAKIFMGDVGSGYLGYVFAVLALYTINLKILPLSYWILIPAVFLCDATFTVLYRIYKREKWYEAHCTHAYQHLVQYGLKHKTVTLSVLAINVFILLPTALSLIYFPDASFLLVNIVLVSFFLLWFIIRKKIKLNHSRA